MDQRDHDQMDFSQIRERVRKNLWKFYFWRVAKTVAIIVTVWLAALVFVGLVYANTLKNAYTQAKEAKVQLETAQHLIINRDFGGAATQLGLANINLAGVQTAANKIPLIRWTPLLAGQVKIVDNLLVVGVNLSASGQKLAVLADEITKPLKNESIPNAQLTAEQKKEIIRKLAEAQPILLQVQKEINDANLALAQIDQSKIILKPVADAVQPMKEVLPVVSRMVNQAVPLISVVPKIFGFEGSQNYLFLIQNNHELRPTGGFIGTYGLLTMDQGEIARLITDNIYNLDRAFANEPGLRTPQQIMAEPSPEPIRIWLEQSNWALRDINWDPDFPSTAQKAIEIYQKETQIAQDLEKELYLRDPKNRASNFKTTFPVEQVDGLMAITPEVIEGLLGLTGPITVDGIRFTADNFQDELEFRVGYEYRTLGISESARKDIIKRIADELQSRILALPLSKSIQAIDVLLGSLSSKAILLYSEDPNLQQQIVERGWGGEINQQSLDYLFVVDSNLGSLKSDQFVDRFANYKLRKEGEDYIATVTVTHRHNGEFAWNSSRLRSFTRVYAPKGSTFISGKGAVYNDKVRDPEGKPGVYFTGEEHGRAVFGGFFVTEPKESNSLEIVYKLPKEVGDKIAEGSYNLLYQKQPGTNHQLTLDLDFGKTIGNSVPENQNKSLNSTVYKYSEKIMADSWYVLGF